MSGSGRETLPDVWEWWESLTDIREWSGYTPGCPRVAGMPSRKSVNSWVALPND